MVNGGLKYGWRLGKSSIRIGGIKDFSPYTGLGIPKAAVAFRDTQPSVLNSYNFFIL